MPAPTTTAELLELVAKSGLTDEPRLRGMVEHLTESGPLPVDPRALATELVRHGVTTGFQVEKLLRGEWQGFDIGQYRVLESIGANTTGALYLCECARLHRLVAVEVVPSWLAAIPNHLDRFFRQARAMASCSHENVVRAYEVAQDGNTHFIVMEYVDGARLYDIVRRGPLDPVRVAHYVAQAADGLQHVHDRGLVHRNVKPTNVLLDRRGRIKVGGMNIVLLPYVTTDDAIRGTPNYIAPEQVTDSTRVDRRADVYSLGCTAYHLLTGRPPFTGGSAAEKLSWHQTRTPEPLRSLRPEVPEELGRVVERMMSKAPEARYQSTAEVAAALEPWCLTPVPPPPTQELPDHCPRVRAAIERTSRPQP